MPEDEFSPETTKVAPLPSPEVAAPKLEFFSLKDIKELCVTSLSEKPVTIQVSDTKAFEFKIRALSGDEMAAAEKFTAGVLPPFRMCKAIVNGKEQSKEELDFYDPGYTKLMAEKNRLRRATVISMGLVGVTIPGESIEKKAEWLGVNLAPGLLENLDEEIRKISSSVFKVVEQANFTSSADLTQS